jgi:hypothetical protein
MQKRIRKGHKYEYSCGEEVDCKLIMQNVKADKPFILNAHVRERQEIWDSF